MEHGETLPHMIARWAAQTPDAVALGAPGLSSMSYRDLFDRVLRFAGELVRCGHSGKRAALLLPQGPELALAFLGASTVCPVTPLNPGQTSGEVERMFDILGTGVLITAAGDESPTIACARARGMPVIELDLSANAGSFERKGESVRPFPLDLVSPASLALILTTSGTTGRPKPVPLTHRNLALSARNIAKSLDLRPSDRSLVVMPLFHVHGLVGSTLSAWAAGASVFCPPPFGPESFFAWLASERPTWFSAVPTVLQSVLGVARARGTKGCPGLRLIRSSSAPLPPAVMAGLEDVFAVPVIEAYGMTEASHQITSNPLPPLARKPGSVGRADGPTEVAIFGTDGARRGPGDAGEVAIRGPAVMSGYEGVSVEDALGDGWLRTGDLGVLDAEGYLTLQGRLKELINRGGSKISPREVDEALLDHPAVAEAVAFACPHPTLGEDLAAAAVLKKGATATAEELRRHLLSRLAGYKVPSQVVILDALPRGPTGKLQRIGLHERLASSLRARWVAPRTPLEETLAGFFAELLGGAPVGIHDNFFGQGGDSLHATRLQSRIQAAFEITLPLRTIFEQPCVEALGRSVEAMILAEIEAMSEDEAQRRLATG